MKKILLTGLSIFFIAGASVSALRAENVGVPSECEDVMLQAFYWNSYQSSPKYGRTKWMDLLTDTVAIRDNFDLVWFPPSAGPTGGGVGYSPKQMSNQDSDWGTKTRLTALIAALHRGNTKVIADIVINHRGNYSSWCNFYQDNFGEFGAHQLKSSHICKNDEVNSSSSAGSCKGKATGANDTGTNFDGARDLDHTNDTVQKWAKAYTQWMLNVMGFDGFRYDMTRGFSGKYVQMYNEAANPYFSVSEYWESLTNTVNHLKATNYNTMVFDFPLKYSIGGIANGSYGKLNKNKSLDAMRSQGLEKYAVTFIDNHDTFERSDNESGEFIGYNVDLSSATNKNKILQANAYILMLPGIPCVFWPHWYSYKSEINELIAVRKRAGIHSESAVTDENTSQNMYTATIQGHHGTVILRLGTKRSKEVPEGYELAVEGGDRGEYTIFIAGAPQGLDDVTNEKASSKFVKDGQLFIRHGEKVYDILGREVK